MSPGLTPETLEQLRAVVARYPQRRSAVLPGLWIAQQQEGWVTPAAMSQIAAETGMEPSEIEAAASFYTMLFTKPAGRHVVAICRSISCMLGGADDLTRHVEQRLGCGHGETTADGAFTVLHAECLAACSGAPAVQIDWEFHENATAAVVDRLLDECLAKPGLEQPSGGAPTTLPARDAALAGRAQPRSAKQRSAS